MSVLLVNGNALAIPLADESVQTVVTSPPYWGLRDYGTARWDGGDPECDHKAAKMKSRYDYAMQPGTRHAELAKTSPGTDAPRWKDVCPTCGARKVDNQLGLEATPDCGMTGLMRLKKNLSEDQKRRVAQWLLDEEHRDV